ncbi:DNA polymerase [Paramuricea clavata]|uniref:DNA-directed DNA polymerase n=1 Tax=Paramuricea clavata TaxID=317549 RepID=A0A6S7J8U7_PARCT|nr:DNA polymerase [Paramuricea clavata]
MCDDEEDEDVHGSGYNELLFFDFECIQENAIHEPNLCVIQPEAGDEWIFEGDNIRNEFCEWLFTKEHEGLSWWPITFKLSYTAERNDMYSQHKPNGGEKTAGRYSLDGYDEETHTAYKFHIWLFLARDTVNKVSEKAIHDLQQAIMEKTQYLKDHGLHVVEMWECDMKKDLELDEDMKQYFEDYDAVDPLEPGHPFYGGRTDATKLFHECKDDEKIMYVDFTSLYPWCNKMTKTVVCRPCIITKNFDDITTYFSLIKLTACADTCNQAPCTHSERERAIQGTWCSVELEKAVEKGYRILQMREVWHFPETSDALFKDYVDTFLKIKQESSGYPKNCTTEEQNTRILGCQRNTIRSRKD